MKTPSIHADGLTAQVSWPDADPQGKMPEPAPLFLLSARTRVAWDAAGQIEVLTGQLLRESHARTDSAELFRKAMLVRMLDLGSVVLSVMGGDDDRPTDELREVVHGPRYLQTDAEEAAHAVQAG